MVPSSEWVQSVFSCQFEVDGKLFVAPSRDYPYEGLMAHHDGEHWRFIDCIAVSLQASDGRLGTLVEDEEWPSIQANPWCVTYHYRYLVPAPEGATAEVKLSVSYRLESRAPLGTAVGTIEFGLLGVHGGEPPPVVVSVQPFLDLRHMFSHADFRGYGVRCHSRSQKENDVRFFDDVVRRIEISNHDRLLTFYLPPGTLTRFNSPAVLHWTCRLGDGQRAERSHPATGRRSTQFLRQTRESAAYFSLQPRFFLNHARLFFRCDMAPRKGLCRIADLDRLDTDSVESDDLQRREIEESIADRVAPDYRDAVVARIAGLTKFKTYLPLLGTDRSVAVPHAGAWWFRTPWFRDVFEGVLSSFETLMAMPSEREMIRNVLDLALTHQHPLSGLIPNRIPEYRNQEACFGSSDATPLCFIVASHYLEKIWDDGLAEKVATAAWKAIQAFRQYGLEPSVTEDGPPRIDPETGLLLTVPHHSWIDTRCQVVEYAGYRMEGLPNRVSSTFVRDLWEHVAEKETIQDLLSLPRFFLPEVNAQWIVMLTRLIPIVGRLEQIGLGISGDDLDPGMMQSRLVGTCDQAKSSFSNVFWNRQRKFLYNVVYEDQRVSDAIECETAVTASAMLGETGVLKRQQLHRVWKRAESSLLVYRTPVLYRWQHCEPPRPFGLMVKNVDRRIFYGDGEYHADVVWPRSTPYLIRLLLLLDHRSTARDLVVNSLDHQMTEGAVFYNHELFSRPCGNNASPDHATCDNPVPVKNPIQFWSQWCDQVVELLSEGEPKKCVRAVGESTSSRS